jgi:hypothetical protein
MNAREPAEDVLRQRDGDGPRGTPVLLRAPGALSDVGHGSHFTGRLRLERMLLPMFAVVGGVSVLKGLGPTVAEGIDFYWMLSYEHGFIRRALIGTLFRPLLRLSSYDQLKPLIFALHVIACAGIIALFLVLFRRAATRGAPLETRITEASSFLCLMCSPLLPTLGHDVGYVDVYLISLTLIALWLALRRQYLPAAGAVLVAPLIHESFLFLWAAVAIVLVWSCVETRRDVWKKLLVAAAPVVSTAAVVFLQSTAAAARAIDTLPVSATLKDGLRAYELEQTVASSVAMMRRYQFPGNGRHIATSLAYLLLPSAAIVCAAVFCHWRAWRTPWTTLLVVTVAAFSPVIAIIFAWDLSRFVVWSNLAAAIALIASGTLLAGRERAP